MEIKIIHSPFEHIIIYNFFEEKELNDITVELETIFEFLLKSKKIKKLNLSANNRGNILTERIAFDVKEFSKNNKNIILKHFEKLFNPDITAILFKDNNFSNFLRCVNETGVVVGVYRDGDYYEPHYDSGVITAVSHIWHRDFIYEGGEWFFPDFNNYTIVPKYNDLIIFPSYLKHGVRKIKNLVNQESLLFNRISLTLLTGSVSGELANRNLKIKW